MDAMETSSSIKVGLIPEISLVESNEQVELVSEFGRFPVAPRGTGTARAFKLLADGSSTERELAMQVLESDGIAELTRYQYAFTQCSLRCMVRYRVFDQGTPILSFQLTVPQRAFAVEYVDDSVPYQISRFAYSHREADATTIEIPLFAGKTLVHNWQASALLAMLTEKKTMPELVQAAQFLSADAVTGVLQLLKSARLLTSCDIESCDEEVNPSLCQWEFHDLLFHTRSRIGRHNQRIGATFRHLGKIPPQPLIKQQAEVTIPLPPPQKPEHEISIFEAIENRHSIRQHGNIPINVQQLSEFLFRVARIRAFWDFEIKTPEGATLDSVQLSNRPYPAGGAIYEMELYLTIHRCDGIPPGMYRYCPVDHTLVQVSDANHKTAGLLQDACMAAGIRETPQILITLASRFQRMSWKYAVISYAATLKNVGVLYQTMYLVATGMGLAACALGSGNSDLFADAAGTNYYAETSVGEFMLGSAPDKEQLPPWLNEKEMRRNDALPDFV
jgi:SagB-type dehydrogenase family enzyme